MFLTGIERVLKRAGVKYTIVSGAMTRSAHKGGLREVRAQMFHTTETADSSFDRGADAPTLGYVRSGLGYPLYNLLYGRSGHVYVIACGTAAHAGKGSGFGMPRDQANFYSIGHSADANSSRYPITAAQLDSFAKVAKAFNDDWDTPRTTVMHGEWAPSRRSDPTKVPGGWAALKRAIAAGEWDGSAPSGGSTGTSSKPKKSSSSSSKTVSQMASEVIAGKHGSGHANRRRSLGVSQAQYERVRAEVNRRAGVSTSSSSSSRPSKSISQMATEVINGQHGTGHANRRRSLGVSQSVYNQVRAEVNRRAGGGSSSGGGKSISQMATEVLQGKHGNGHANRQRSLGVNNATYAAVRKEVNRRS